jgi:hypothetical protein
MAILSIITNTAYHANELNAIGAISAKVRFGLIKRFLTIYPICDKGHIKYCSGLI